MNARNSPLGFIALGAAFGIVFDYLKVEASPFALFGAIPGAAIAALIVWLFTGPRPHGDSETDRIEPH
jgi:ABC-type Fe3+-siderophore transport system permease subunit